MSYRSWTDSDLEIAVKSSKTKSEVLRKLGLKSRNSGNFQYVDAHIRRLQLDISHFSEFIVGHLPGQKQNLEEILIKKEGQVYTSYLKGRLIRSGLLEEKCSICEITEWLGQKLSLHLDHIDGDRQNCELDNLRLLCPNCHSLTPTYSRRKNQGEKNKCGRCMKVISKNAKMCLPCNAILKRGTKLKIQWPPHQILLKLVESDGYSTVGKKLGVSDKAVAKRLKRNDNSCLVP